MAVPPARNCLHNPTRTAGLRRPSSRSDRQGRPASPCAGRIRRRIRLSDVRSSTLSSTAICRRFCGPSGRPADFSYVYMQSSDYYVGKILFKLLGQPVEQQKQRAHMRAVLFVGFPAALAGAVSASVFYRYGLYIIFRMLLEALVQGIINYPVNILVCQAQLLVVHPHAVDLRIVFRMLREISVGRHKGKEGVAPLPAIYGV